jgi:tetratricopeptide (TPR) repeat protein
LTLQPLETGLEQELIEALAHERGLAIDVIQKIGRSAGGNPLFAEEMVAMIAEAGPEAGVPSVIKMLIAARLDALPRDERLALQLAAVIGKVFWLGGVQALRPSLGDRLPGLLEALERKDLLREAPRSQLRSERQYAFKHDLIRDVAYDVLPRSERRTLHGQTLAWLERTAGEMAEAFLDQLTHHAVEAGQQACAIDYLVRAAERANRAAAHRQAAALLDQAVSLARDLGEPLQAAELQIRRGRALMSVGLWSEARPELEAALAALPAEHAEQRAQVFVYLADVHTFLLDLDGLRRTAGEVQASAEAAGRPDLAAAGIAKQALAESLEGNLEASVALFQQAEARADNARMDYSGGMDVQSLNLYWLGRYAEAIPLAQEAVALARGDTSGTIETLPDLGLAYASAGRYVEAEQVFAEARRFGREYETWPMLARAIAMSAGWRLSVFDWHTHEALAAEAREMARSANFVPPQVSAGIDLVLNYARRGEVALADRLLPEIDAGMVRAGAWHRWLWRLRAAQARAELSLARGAWDQALEHSEASLAASQTHGRVKYAALALEARAAALLALGRKAEALGDLRRAVELARPSGDPAMLLRVGAALLAVQGDDVLAAEVSAAAAGIHAALPDPQVRRQFESTELVQRWLNPERLA